MTDYDSFSPATLGTFFFAFHAGAKELILFYIEREMFPSHLWLFTFISRTSCFLMRSFVEREVLL